MAQILLAIKPEYVEKILAGEKIYEYRKVAPAEKVSKIYIYETKPVSKVVGEAYVIDTIVTSSGDNKNISNIGDAIYSLTVCRTSSNSIDANKQAGINLIELENYFSGCNKAYAYRLGKVIKYKKPKKLVEVGVRTAPQNYIYMGKD